MSEIRTVEALIAAFEQQSTAADNVADCADDSLIGNAWRREAWAWREAARMARALAARQEGE